MNLTRTISEPLARQIAFHDSFNRNVKLTFGALTRLGETARSHGQELLPTGGEPWGAPRKLRNPDTDIPLATAFLSEIGLVRAASAFEDFLTGIGAELDRCEFRKRAVAGGTPTEASDHPSGSAKDEEATQASLGRIAKRLDIVQDEMADDLTMAKFFDVARNCVVHRSGRASESLAKMHASEEMAAALKTWPRRVGKWAIGVPKVTRGHAVAWLPRHAIMASAVYHRCAVAVDKKAVSLLGDRGLVAMAAHWGLLDDAPVPVETTVDAQSLVLTLLMRRYHVREVNKSEVVALLRECGIWPGVRKSFEERALTMPSRAKRRAAGKAEAGAGKRSKRA